LLPIAAAAAIGGGIGWVRGRNVVSYVGKEGIASYVLTKDRSSPKQTHYLLFRSASALRTSATRKFMNGIYTGTDYSFSWSNDQGKTVYHISGEYHLTPKTAKHPYIFARAAEFSWSNYLLPKLVEQLDRAGAVHFEIKPPDSITVGRGFVDLFFSGKSAHCEREDVESISLHDGYFSIKRKDAQVGWFSSTGVFRFPYGQMPNARLFHFVVENLLGMPIV
jgi:hypothetical protein